MSRHPNEPLLTLPPHSVEAEQGILAALLLDNAVSIALDDLGAADFYRSSHRIIYSHTCALIEAGQPADIVTVAESIERANEADETGGIAYLAMIANGLALNAAVPSYVRIVKQASLKRQLVVEYSNAAQSAGNGIDADTVIALTDERITEIRKRAFHDRPTTVPGIVPVADFLTAARPADWIVQGIIQRGSLYACTAPTNHGKTAVQINLSLSVAGGIPFCDHQITRSKTVILCGENQDGFRVRLRASMMDMDIDPSYLDGWLFVLPYAAPLGTIIDRVESQINTIGDVGQILIDTSTAYFGGDKEDDNVQALEHARLMRRLCECSGRPAVIANCHPPKHTADRESCIPRGGSAFLNEIDGNLTCWAEDNVCELHWTRKKRGPDFEPMAFEFLPSTQIDCGIEVKTIVARWVNAQREESLRRELTARENLVLRTLLSYPKASLAFWCDRAGIVGADATPGKSTFSRILKRLESFKLVGRNRYGWHLTKAGEMEAKG